MIPRTTVDIGEEEVRAIQRVIRSGQFVKGQEAEKLEEEFASYQNCKYGATVNSGTSALYLSLLAMAVGKGDEVILTPNTFAATVNAIIMIGAKPRFVDINPDTFNIDTTKLEKQITARTKCIIPTHLYGLMSDMNPIKDIAEYYELYVLEDSCQAHGAKYKGKKAGEIGDISAFSFFPTKNVTVGGDGGIAISNNEELIDNIKALRDHGRIKGEHKIAGFNNRLSEILASIGRVQLKKLDGYNEHRRKIASMYRYYFSALDEIKFPIEPNGYKHVYHLYTIKTEKRDELKEYLKHNGINSKIMYPEKLNELNYVPGNQKMPVNDVINKQVLSLPISGTMPLNQVRKVSKIIFDFFEKQVIKG